MERESGKTSGAASSINWTRTEGNEVTMGTTGLLLGTVKKNFFKPSSRSRLCKFEHCRRFVSLCLSLSSTSSSLVLCAALVEALRSGEKTCRDLKEVAVDYQTSKRRLCEVWPFSFWPAPFEGADDFVAPLPLSSSSSSSSSSSCRD